MSNTGPVQWVKSSYSGGEGGQCLEWAPSVAAASGIVPIRDSKNPQGGTIKVEPASWRRFVSFASDQGI
ncbi:DUF397 domain-containing protein [Streptomyces sp. NPDC003328]